MNVIEAIKRTRAALASMLEIMPDDMPEKAHLRVLNSDCEELFAQYENGLITDTMLKYAMIETLNNAQFLINSGG